MSDTPNLMKLRQMLRDSESLLQDAVDDAVQEVCANLVIVADQEGAHPKDGTPALFAMASDIECDCTLHAEKSCHSIGDLIRDAASWLPRDDMEKALLAIESVIASVRKHDYTSIPFSAQTKLD